MLGRWVKSRATLFNLRTTSVHSGQELGEAGMQASDTAVTVFDERDNAEDALNALTDSGFRGIATLSDVLCRARCDPALLAFIKCHLTSMVRWNILRVLARYGLPVAPE